jgi:hypothetical protein
LQRQPQPPIRLEMNIDPVQRKISSETKIKEKLNTFSQTSSTNLSLQKRHFPTNEFSARVQLKQRHT